MAISSIEYTDYGQQYLTLPLTFNNDTGGLVVVNKIYIQNVFEGGVPIDSDLVLTINESATDYSEASQLYSTDFIVEHVNMNEASNKNFKVGQVVSLEPSTSITFQVEFNPNISKTLINRGSFIGRVVIEYDENGTTKIPFSLNINAECSDKQITLMSGVQYGNISSIFGVSRNKVRKLN